MIFCSGSYRRQTDMDVDEFQPNRSRQRGMAASSVAGVMEDRPVPLRGSRHFVPRA